MKIESTASGATAALFQGGDRAPALTFGPLALADIVRYAGASGDLNPVHYDADLARSLGHPDVFAMGMLPGALLDAFAASWLRPLRVRSLDLRFLDRVWTNEVLECGGEVVRVDGDPIERLHAKLWVRAADGTPKVDGACIAVSVDGGAG